MLCSTERSFSVEIQWVDVDIKVCSCGLSVSPMTHGDLSRMKPISCPMKAVTLSCISKKMDRWVDKVLNIYNPQGNSCLTLQCTVYRD